MRLKSYQQTNVKKLTQTFYSISFWCLTGDWNLPFSFNSIWSWLIKSLWCFMRAAAWCRKERWTFYQIPCARAQHCVFSFWELKLLLWSLSVICGILKWIKSIFTRTLIMAFVGIRHAWFYILGNQWGQRFPEFFIAKKQSWVLTLVIAIGWIKHPYDLHCLKSLKKRADGENCGPEHPVLRRLSEVQQIPVIH